MAWKPALSAGATALVLIGSLTFNSIRTQDLIMKKLTPVIFVEEIEPCLDFWLNLGFEKTMEVPEGARLGFAAVQSGLVEVMYQSRESVKNDVPALAAGSFAKSGSLFIRVDDLNAIKPKLEGAEKIFDERTTFYGAREIGVRAPCGTAVVFAEFAEGA